jgi:lactate permease
MTRQILAPIDGSLGVSALVAALPLVLLLVLLGVLRVRSVLASAAGLLGTFVVAVLAFRLPAMTALSGAAEGALFGLFPIVWIIVNAVWLSRLLASSGHAVALRRVFLRMSGDFRVQALVIAFCFGSLLESMAGFGAPIAVVAAILLALGFSPVRAATVAMFADAAGTAFGSVGNPIFALAKATGLPADHLGEMVGRQAPIVALFVPFALVVVLDGRRGFRQLWPVALVTGLGFALGQFATANYLTFQLADLIGALVATAAAAVLLRFWSPRQMVTAPADADESAAEETGGSAVRAFAPYAVLIVLLALVSLNGPIATWVARFSITFPWPGVHVLGRNGKPLALAQFQFGWLGATGTVLLVTGLLGAVILGVGARAALREYRDGLVQVRDAAVTVVLVMALAYLMNYSGQAVTIGSWLAGAGGAFGLLSPILGWLGVAATGSDTSANALFGAVQVAAARHIGGSTFLFAAANSEAGALGKLISPQNLAMAGAAVGLGGGEGRLLRRTVWWSVGALVGFGLLVYLMSVGPLSWLVVR